MIEQGCFGLKSVLSTLDPLLQSMKESENLYKVILDIARFNLLTHNTSPCLFLFVQSTLNLLAY